MAGQSPKTRGPEAAVELCGRKGGVRRDFGRGLVGVFGCVVVPLLLVCCEGEEDETKEGLGEQSVYGLGFGDGCGEEHDICGHGDGKEKDL